MRRPLLVVNVMLVAVGLACAGYIIHALVAPLPEPAIVVARSAGRPARPAMPPEPLPRDGYAVVATRNLFSPTRDETPPAPARVVAPPPVPTPFLYGVVMREETPIAYLEDPVTKRVFGYRIGDAIGGATIETIGPDRVVLNRPQGPVDVLLHDPAKPRRTAAAPGGALVPPGVSAPMPPTAQSPRSPPAVGSRPTPETRARARPPTKCPARVPPSNGVGGP